jgi:hypothetical protein
MAAASSSVSLGINDPDLFGMEWDLFGEDAQGQDHDSDDDIFAQTSVSVTLPLTAMSKSKDTSFVILGFACSQQYHRLLGPNVWLLQSSGRPGSLRELLLFIAWKVTEGAGLFAMLHLHRDIAPVSRVCFSNSPLPHSLRY